MTISEAPIWPFLFGVLSVYPFFPLRHVPVMDRLKISFPRLILYASVIMLVQGFTYLWLSYSYPFGGFVLSWHRKIFMLPYVLLTLIFVKDNKSKTLFMDFFMVGIVMSVIDLSYIINRTWFADSFAVAPYRTDVFIRGTITILIYPALYLLFKKNMRPIMQIEVVSIWKYLTCIPLVFSIISIITTMEAFDHKISLVILSIRFSVIVGSVLVVALLTKVIKQMELAVKLEEKSKQSERLLALQGEHYIALSQNIEQARAARHDLRHQLTVISTMVEHKEYEKLTLFVEQYRKSISIDKDMVLCENYTANVIICHYIALAHTEGIPDIDVQCVLGKCNGIDDTDLCILLGNLLENAIEGCKTLPSEKRKMKIRISTHAGNLMLTVDNTFDGIINFENENFISRKREGEQKGIGLASVMAVVDKYDGLLRWEETNGWFLVSVQMIVNNE